MKMDLISSSYNQDSVEKQFNLTTTGNMIETKDETPFYLLKETPGF
jgi:hypothetical protein